MSSGHDYALETLAPPPADPEQGRIGEKEDAVNYRGPYWFVSFRFADDGETLVFDRAEYEQPVADLKDHLIEKATDHGFDADGVFDGRIERLRNVPDEICEVVAADYPIDGYGDADDGDRDPESWLYDGECPDCGPVVCIELVGESDLCMKCGGAVGDAD